MKYVLLLRGLNVGGKHTVSMQEFKAQLASLGYKSIQSYLNSGNFIFQTNQEKAVVESDLQKLIQGSYSFSLPFALLTENEYRASMKQLPEWWQQPLARKNVLFFIGPIDKQELRAHLKTVITDREVIFIGEHALFWGIYKTADLGRTAYSQRLSRMSLYQQVTIRNYNTYQKLFPLLVVDDESNLKNSGGRT